MIDMTIPELEKWVNEVHKKAHLEMDVRRLRILWSRELFLQKLIFAKQLEIIKKDKIPYDPKKGF